MKELDPLVFWAVFREMLGPWLWVIIAGATIATLAFVWVLVRERGLAARRLVWSELAGLAGGMAALVIMMAVTNSRLADLGGPIDWLLALGIFVAGFIGATLGVYALLGVFGIAKAPAEEADAAAARARAGRDAYAAR